MGYPPQLIITFGDLPQLIITFFGPARLSQPVLPDSSEPPPMIMSQNYLKRLERLNEMLSKKIVMFTAYAGLGYNSTKTTFNVNTSSNTNIGYRIAGLDLDVEDLTSFEFESNNNLRANVGFRFQLAVLALQANYTFSEYPVATVGLGISIR